MSVAHSIDDEEAESGFRIRDFTEGRGDTTSSQKSHQRPKAVELELRVLLVVALEASERASLRSASK